MQFLKQKNGLFPNIISQFNPITFLTGPSIEVKRKRKKKISTHLGSVLKDITDDFHRGLRRVNVGVPYHKLF